MDRQTDDVSGQVVDFPNQRPLDRDYACYIRRRLLAGLLSPQAAVAALRARDPKVTAEALAALLSEGEE